MFYKSIRSRCLGRYPKKRREQPMVVIFSKKTICGIQKKDLFTDVAFQNIEN